MGRDDFTKIPGGLPGVETRGELIFSYGVAKRRFPDSDGGLISQVRLADMGALHSFFSQDKVFDALERGSRQATVEMYKKIADTGSASPLLQLAQLKIGTALAEDVEPGDYTLALQPIEGYTTPEAQTMPGAAPNSPVRMPMASRLRRWRLKISCRSGLLACSASASKAITR